MVAVHAWPKQRVACIPVIDVFDISDPFELALQLLKLGGVPTLVLGVLVLANKAATWWQTTQRGLRVARRAGAGLGRGGRALVRSPAGFASAAALSVVVIAAQAAAVGMVFLVANFAELAFDEERFSTIEQLVRARGAGALTADFLIDFVVFDWITVGHAGLSALLLGRGYMRAGRDLEWPAIVMALPVVLVGTVMVFAVGLYLFFSLFVLFIMFLTQGGDDGWFTEVGPMVLLQAAAAVVAVAYFWVCKYAYRASETVAATWATVHSGR